MYNFMVICIDCLRYDYSKSLLRARSLSEAVKQHGIWYENAYTTSPWTYPATNSLLTGIYPRHHGARHEGVYRENAIEPWPAGLNPHIPTIFSELKRHGYYTLGVSTIYWSLNPRSEYKDCDRIVRSEEQEVFYKNTKAEWVVDAFTQTYETEIRGAPFFAYLHLIDLHRPYDLGIAISNCPDSVEVLDGIAEWDIRRYLCDERDATRFKRNKVKLYNGLVHYIGSQVSRLIQFLKQRGIFNRTVLVITADHGEEFWDHTDFEIANYWCGLKSSRDWLLGTGHGHTMFNELVHVPLILISPAIARAGSVQSLPVSIVDVFPTLLEMIGAEPSGSVDGRSLLNPDQTDREILVESILYGFEKKALIHGSMKYISCPWEVQLTAYDLLADPTEMNALSDFRHSAKITSKLQALFEQPSQI